LTVGTAHAAETKKAPVAAPASQSQAQAPWFQRFTASAGATEGAHLAPGQAQTEQTITWQANDKWNLTLNLKDADRTKVTSRDEAAVGAFYHFTPSIRVGGEVAVADTPNAAKTTPKDDKDQAATVKLESAFKF
jgi:hypothetical protein